MAEKMDMMYNVSEIDPELIMNMTLWEYVDWQGGNAWIEGIYFYPYTIIFIFGTFLNVFCIITYFRKAFNNPMYFYFRVFSIVNLVQSSLGIMYGLCSGIRYLGPLDPQICCWYTSVYIAIASTCTYYGATLQIIVLLDRLKTFNLTVKKVFKISPKIVCLALLIICMIVNSFYALVWVPEEFVWYSYRETTGLYEKDSVWFLMVSSIADSDLGYYMNLIVFTVRDICTLVAFIVLSLTLLYYMRQFFKNKAKMAKPKAAAEGSAAAEAPKGKQMSSAEEKFLIMIMVTVTLTIFTRITYFITSVWYLIENTVEAYIFSIFAEIMIAITASVQFFIYFFFNKIFKNEFMKILGMEVKE